MINEVAGRIIPTLDDQKHAVGFNMPRLCQCLTWPQQEGENDTKRYRKTSDHFGAALELEFEAKLDSASIPGAPNDSEGAAPQIFAGER